MHSNTKCSDRQACWYRCGCGLVGALVGGRGCASRKSLLLCLSLITCRFYEKVRIANANRFRISVASAAPPNPIFR
jgi:hypothetical protein